MNNEQNKEIILSDEKDLLNSLTEIIDIYKKSSKGLEVLNRYSLGGSDSTNIINSFGRPQLKQYIDALSEIDNDEKLLIYKEVIKVEEDECIKLINELNIESIDYFDLELKQPSEIDYNSIKITYENMLFYRKQAKSLRNTLSKLKINEQIITEIKKINLKINNIKDNTNNISKEMPRNTKFTL